jgi:hypothetical protein
MPPKDKVVKQLKRTQRHIVDLEVSGKTVPPEVLNRAHSLQVDAIGAQKGSKAQLGDVAGVRNPVSRMGGG